jgi:hypothetical protein
MPMRTAWSRLRLLFTRNGALGAAHVSVTGGPYAHRHRL